MGVHVLFIHSYYVKNFVYTYDESEVEDHVGEERAELRAHGDGVDALLLQPLHVVHCHVAREKQEVVLERWEAARQGLC